MESGLGKMGGKAVSARRALAFAARPARLLAKHAARVVFPHFCVGCGQEGNVLCEYCRVELYALGQAQGIFFCPPCGDCVAGWGRCGSVRCRRAPLDGFISFGRYGDPVLRELLHLYKYEKVAEAADELGSFFGSMLDRCRDAVLAGAAAARVVSVPMHFYREAERGFNQSEFLAWIFSDQLGLNFKKILLGRRFRAKPQAKIEDAQKRRKNADSSVFVWGGTARGSYVIVDDVFTSGATLNECARALKSAGASKVLAVTLLKG